MRVHFRPCVLFCRYDEQQYSLPRWRDLSVSRMGMYDDMYAYLPTQGWMFLPLLAIWISRTTVSGA